MRQTRCFFEPCVKSIFAALCVTAVGCGDIEVDDEQDVSSKASDGAQSSSGSKGSTSDPDAQAPSKEDASNSDGPDGDDDASESSPEDSSSSDKGNAQKPKSKKDWDDVVNKVFPDDKVVSIEISFKGEGLSQMLDDWRSKREKSYQETTIRWDGKEVVGAGTRLKGYSTLMSASGGFPGGGGGGLRPSSKLPLKLNFDRFGGERLDHIDKVSLGTNAFDKSQMRERLSAKMFRKMGVPAAKTAFATVKLNDKTVGLYTIVQNINKRFLKQHFGTKNNADDGNLYKCVALERRGPGGNSGNPRNLVCSLRWQGDKKSDYLRTTGCASGYEACGLVLKSNEDDPEKSDYKDLIHFLDVLNNSKDEVFEEEIQEVFDVDNFLRFMAVTVGMVNLDSYLGRINNYYLYHRPDTGKFIMLPWDHNMSYAHYPGVRGLSDLTKYPVKDPLSVQRNRDNYVLIDRILKVPAFQERYLEYLETFLDEHFTQSEHQTIIDTFERLIREPLEEDPNRRFSMESFELAISDQQGGGSTGMGRQYNLLNFVERRVAYVKGEL